MNFSSFFRLEENLNLDRKTLYILRWIALVGQFIAINLVYFYFGFTVSCGAKLLNYLCRINYKLISTI